MVDNPVELLWRWSDDPKIGPVIKQALKFLEGSKFNQRQSPAKGQSSLGVARMYEVRQGLSNFKAHAFVGLPEAIEILRSQDVLVHLCVLEAEKGLVSIWLDEKQERPLAVVLAIYQA
jgi:hypothetical protein